MDGSQMLAGFRAKFRVDELLVARTPAWSWSVRPGQVTLGCGVLSLNRHAAQFSASHLKRDSHATDRV